MCGQPPRKAVKRRSKGGQKQKHFVPAFVLSHRGAVVNVKAVVCWVELPSPQVPASVHPVAAVARPVWEASKVPPMNGESFGRAFGTAHASTKPPPAPSCFSPDRPFPGHSSPVPGSFELGGHGGLVERQPADRVGRQHAGVDPEPHEVPARHQPAAGRRTDRGLSRLIGWCDRGIDGGGGWGWGVAVRVWRRG